MQALNRKLLTLTGKKFKKWEEREIVAGEGI
jgi:hypothetical protein